MWTLDMRLSFGDFVIDFDERRLLSGGQEVRLTPKAFDLLKTRVAAIHGGGPMAANFLHNPTAGVRRPRMMVSLPQGNMQPAGTGPATAASS